MISSEPRNMETESDCQTVPAWVIRMRHAPWLTWAPRMLAALALLAFGCWFWQTSFVESPKLDVPIEFATSGLATRLMGER